MREDGAPNGSRALCNCEQLSLLYTRTLLKEVRHEIMRSKRILIVAAAIVRSKRILIVAAAIVALGYYASLSLSQTPSSKTKPTRSQTPSSKTKPTSEAVRAERAATVLGEIMEAPDQGIPEALLRRAYGIAVIPHVVKGAFGIGGRYGKGLVAQRSANGGWGTPLFVQIGGGSFGLQLGVEATDVIMVFTNRDGIMPLLRGKLKIGADASATAGPVGRKAEVGTDILLNSAIYSYSRSKGLFAGIALDGAVIQLDNDANRNVYGKKSVAGDATGIKMSNTAMAVVQPFLRALQKYVPGITPTAVRN